MKRFAGQVEGHRPRRLVGVLLNLVKVGLGHVSQVASGASASESNLEAKPLCGEQGGDGDTPCAARLRTPSGLERCRDAFVSLIMLTDALRVL